MRPITILHLITTLDIGGTERMLFKLLSFMDKEKFSNEVVCLTNIGPVGEKIIGEGLPVGALNMPRGSLTVKGLIDLWRILRAKRPMILQTWLYHSDLLGFFIGRTAGVENICWNIRCSSVDLNRYTPSTKWILRFCSIFSYFPKVVITNSVKAVSFHISHGYRSKGWKVIPNGFDLSTFKPDNGAKKILLGELGLGGIQEDKIKGGMGRGRDNEGCFLIGFIARYDPMKDHSTFIKAACNLLEERSFVHFVLAGREIEPGNNILVDQIPHKWWKHFHLLGEREDIEKVTAALDIASLASHGEGFPNIVCEAMACGVPCVVMDVGDSARIIGDTGRVTPPGDPQALANGWKELIDLDKPERDALGTAARKRVMDYFDLNKIVKQYEVLYRSFFKDLKGP